MIRNRSAQTDHAAQSRLLIVRPLPVMQSLPRLLAEEYRVDLVDSLSAARASIANNPSLILLGGDRDGLSLLRELREKYTTPVVLFEAPLARTDAVMGLELGADDYIVPPIDHRELMARLRSLLRRVRMDKLGLNSLHATKVVANFEGWRFGLRSRRLTSPSGDVVAVTTREFDLLSTFVERAGEPLSRDFLMVAVAGVTWRAFDRRIDVLVSRLRKKLAQSDPTGSNLIETVRGAGYQFVAPVAYD